MVIWVQECIFYLFIFFFLSFFRGFFFLLLIHLNRNKLFWICSISSNVTFSGVGIGDFLFPVTAIFFFVWKECQSYPHTYKLEVSSVIEKSVLLGKNRRISIPHLLFISFQYSCTLYNLVSFYAADIAPDSATRCSDLTTSTHQLLKWLDNIP